MNVWNQKPKQIIIFLTLVMFFCLLAMEFLQSLSFVSVTLLLFYSLYRVLIQEFRVFKNGNKAKNGMLLPPGPRKLPLIGSIHHLVGHLPHRRLRDLADKYGPLMHLKLGQVPVVVISSSRIAKEIMKTHDLAFSGRPRLLATTVVFYDNQDIAFSSYGDYWRQMRKICVMELLGAKNVRSFCSIREDEVASLVESVRGLSGQSINLTEKILSFTGSVVCRAAFGKRGKEQDTLIAQMKELTVFLGAGGSDIADLFPSLRWLHRISSLKPKLLKMRRQIDKVFDSIIDEHKQNLATNNNGGNGESGEEDDLIDVLLRLKDSGDLQFPITNDGIKAVIFDMFAAGTETSSTTVEWALAEMIKNSRIMEKAQAEVREALKGKTKISESDIKELKYIKLVIKETLRLHPPVPLLLPRECREQCNIDGYEIAAKTRVLVNAWAIGRDPAYWDNPDEFEPERFDGKSTDFIGNHFEFIPFGGGRRICPGMSFGLSNIELPLAHLIYHFDWKLPGEIKHDELDMMESPGLTVGRRNNLYVIAMPHRPSFHR